MMEKYSLSAFLIAMLSACGTVQHDGTASIDLAGEWKFTTDSAVWNASITLPGSMTSNGLGDEVDINTPWTGEIVDRSFFTDDKYAKYREASNFKVPFWLQPQKYYKGVAWYSKDVEIPADWEGNDVSLFL